MKDLHGISGLAIVLLAYGLIAALLHLSHGVDYRGIRAAVSATPSRLIRLAVFSAGISYLALVARDLCALRYVQVVVPVPLMLLASFCGTALDHTVGFGKWTGRAVR